MDRWAERNVKGQHLEKDDRVADAVELYEKNLEEGCDTPFTYRRLAIIYRRQKDYDNEIRAIEAAIPALREHPARSYFHDRLGKARSLRAKHLDREPEPIVNENKLQEKVQGCMWLTVGAIMLAAFLYLLLLG